MSPGPRVQVAQPLPECLHPSCGAPLSRETAARNGGFCTPHLVQHPLEWDRARARARAAAQDRAARARRQALR